MNIARFVAPAFLAALTMLAPHALCGQTVTTIKVDAGKDRHAISPLIYGVCWASADQLKLLNSPLNRAGGNNETRYNWQLNASNHAADWYFESIGDDSPTPGEREDTFISQSKEGGAQPMLTMPMIGWVAKLGPNRQPLWSFSVSKYGAQQKTDSQRSDAGNGARPDGKTFVTDNDPDDANMQVGVDFQRGWVKHLIEKWGKEAKGGLRYYIMDNEPMIWHETHRDVHPKGATMDEYLADFLGYASMVKSEDGNASVCAPESWGWLGYLYSGADKQYLDQHQFAGHPDMDAHGGMFFIPWLLKSIRDHDAKTGTRLLDVLTVHCYPQANAGGGETSTANELLRNRSTRAFWDPSYTDESWIKDKVMLIPRLKAWVKEYYPGTKIGITEYNWGAENSMSGATAQADILGIFGREGLYLATRWTTPSTGSPTFKAIQIYRNYDGNKSTFGDTSVSDTVPNPDDISSFAAIRSSDHSLTIMVINKQLSSTKVSLDIAHFKGAGMSHVWLLSGDGKEIAARPDVPVQSNRLQATLPQQSIMLIVVPALGH